jgi:hypothetical protein
VSEKLSPTPNSTARILDEREVKEIAKKVRLARYMWDTEEGRMDLARFAHEAALLVLSEKAPTFELIDAVVAFLEKQAGTIYNLEGFDRVSMAIHNHPLSHIDEKKR